MPAAQPVVLLTLAHAGRTWRLSSSPCDVLDGDTSLHYRGGMAATDLYEEAPIGEPAEPPSVPVDVIVDGDLSALLADGHLLDDVQGELALWTPGTEYAARRIYVAGRADIESGGYLGRPLRLTVRGDDAVEVPSEWPPPDARICAETWDTRPSPSQPLREYDDSCDGETYPQVIGMCGAIQTGGSPAAIAGSPVYPVILDGIGGWAGLLRYTPWGDITTWTSLSPPRGAFGIVSDGWLYPGEGTRKGVIWIAPDDGSIPPDWHPADLYYAVDGLGRVVTLARLQLPLPAWGSITSGLAYYASIPSPCSGIARRDWRGGLAGAGSVIRWALEQTAIRVDWRRTVPALAELDRYELAGYWDQSCSPWAWVQEHIIPVTPSTWVPGPRGLYPVVWRLGATASTADLDLIDGLDCTIEGEPRQEGADEVIGRSTLDYAPSDIDGTYRRRLVYHGGPEPETTRSVPTPYGRGVQQRRGTWCGARAIVPELALMSDVIYADSTADLYVSRLARLRSAPWQVWRVVAPWTSRLARAEPGMVVALTSPRYSIDRQVVHVRRAGILGGMCYADLVQVP